MSNANNRYDPAPVEAQVLGWKNHSEYFEIYYKLKSDFNSLYNASMMDFTQIPLTFTKLFEFIGHIRGQLTKKMNKSIITEKRNEILDLIASKEKKIKVLDLIDDFYDEVIKICTNLELEPKPEEEKVDEIESTKDDRVRNALRAYEIIYGK